MIVTVDTGGTKTLVASFSKDGQLGDVIRFETPKDQTEYINLLRKTLVDNYAGKDVEAVAIALPGIIRNGVAVWCNNLGWKNFHAQETLAGVLGDAPVWIENDANLAGLAETRSLDKIPESSLYVTVSTGIGTGFVTNGKIDPGVRYSEGGHMLVEYKGKVQEWEKFGSGRAIVAKYHKFARDIHSKRIWRQIAGRISRGFLAIIPMLQPDVIIIGGSVGTYFDRYGNDLTDILKKHLPAHIPVPKIVQAKHPEQAVIYGCYYYATDCLAAR